MQGTWMRSLGQAGPGSSLLANEGLWCYHGLALNIEGRTRGSDRGLGTLPDPSQATSMTHGPTKGILALSHSVLQWVPGPDHEPLFASLPQAHAMCDHASHVTTIYSRVLQNWIWSQTGNMQKWPATVPLS